MFELNPFVCSCVACPTRKESEIMVEISDTRDRCISQDIELPRLLSSHAFFDMPIADPKAAERKEQSRPTLRRGDLVGEDAITCDEEHVARSLEPLGTEIIPSAPLGTNPAVTEPS